MFCTTREHRIGRENYDKILHQWYGLDKTFQNEKFSLRTRIIARICIV